MCNTTVINWLYSIVYTGILPGNAWEEAYTTSTLRPHSNLYYNIYPFIPSEQYIILDLVNLVLLIEVNGLLKMDKVLMLQLSP